MQSTSQSGSGRGGFRPAVGLPQRAVGVIAAMAVGSFSFMVFGPLADQRASTLAAAGPTARPVARAAPTPPATEPPRQVAALSRPGRTR